MSEETLHLTPEEIEALVERGYAVNLVDAQTAAAALQAPALDPQARAAFIRQLDAWIDLARFAKWLSAGLAVGSVVLSLFLLSAMTWDDLFKGSNLWEFSIVLFALAVFVASPLAIFVIGRPLKGIDEWAPTLSMTRKQDSETRS